jgi:transcriptional regulator with XRE-family HTH domain
MPREMANIKEIFAANLRENRRKRGLTQEKLAEKADMSLHYLAMLEVANNFPSGEMLEKLAKALDIQTFQLFTPTSTLEGALLHLEQTIVSSIEKVVIETIKQAIPNESQNTEKITVSKTACSPNEELEQFRRDLLHEIDCAVSKAVKKSFTEEMNILKKE